MKCFECGAELDLDTQYTINDRTYCEYCADVIADEEFSDLTTREKVESLGGEVKDY